MRKDLGPKQIAWLEANVPSFKSARTAVQRMIAAQEENAKLRSVVDDMEMVRTVAREVA